MGKQSNGRDKRKTKAGTERKAEMKTDNKGKGEKPVTVEAV